MFKKIMLFILKSLKWPAVYILVPYLIFILAGRDGVTKNPLLIGGLIALFAFVGGIFTSSLFTENFMVSTGISAGLYLIISLFLSIPSDAWENEIGFDTVKIILFLFLVACVFLGDLIVMIIRKIMRYVRNKKLRN